MLDDRFMTLNVAGPAGTDALLIDLLLKLYWRSK